MNQEIRKWRGREEFSVSIVSFERKKLENRIDTREKPLFTLQFWGFAQNLLHTDWNGSKLKVMRLPSTGISRCSCSCRNNFSTATSSFLPFSLLRRSLFSNTRIIHELLYQMPRSTIDRNFLPKFRSWSSLFYAVSLLEWLMTITCIAKRGRHAIPVGNSILFLQHDALQRV